MRTQTKLVQDTDARNFDEQVNEALVWLEDERDADILDVQYVAINIDGYISREAFITFKMPTPYFDNEDEE